MKEKSLAKKLTPYPEEASGQDEEVLSQRSDGQSVTNGRQDNGRQDNGHQDNGNTQSSQPEGDGRKDSQSSGSKKRVMDEEIKEAVSILVSNLKTTFGEKIKEKRTEKLMMKVASAAHMIKIRINQSGKIIQREVMEELKMIKKDLELQDNVNMACEKIVENSAKSVEVRN